MPVFSLVQVSGNVPGNPQQAVELLLQARIPGAPIGFSGLDDRRAGKLRDLFPTLEPWIDGPCITVMDGA
ncbi:MAG: hypothetical protein KC656_24245, partial [Myxococcales bacterium]|nr:hypothetical protein [Myxococcales bacterium]